MKIAITADAHLRGRLETPERYVALENIFEQCQKEDVKKVLILGDLFDRDFNNYHDLDELCSVYEELQITMLPGNHDRGLKRKFFTARNIRVIEEPLLEKVNARLNFLFFPYEAETSLDEALATFAKKNRVEGRFVLFGHGDWLSGMRQPNAYEGGFYMPLSRRALEKFNPLRAFLGHIHQTDFGADRMTAVVYPGSPCGLDINETGRRRFLLYDTEDNRLESRYVDTQVLYFKETLLAMPVEDEISRLQGLIKKMVEGWELTGTDLQKVRLRLAVRGFTRDKKTLSQFVRQEIAGYGIAFYDPEGPDFSDLRITSDESETRLVIFKSFQEKLKEVDLSRFHATSNEILEEAMQVIWGVKK